VKTFLGILKVEFDMSIRRWGVMVIFGAVGLFYLVSSFWPSPSDPIWNTVSFNDLWKLAGQMAFSMNVLMPVVAGIAAADRMARDGKLNIEELLRSTQLRRWPYVLGKFMGVLLSLLIPVLVTTLLTAVVLVFKGCKPIILIYSLAAMALINIPAMAFVTAFSLACPMVIPVRVYQILFTGYWYWGNFLSPKVMPTLTDTILNAAGAYALEGFFMGGYTLVFYHLTFSAFEAVLNILVILCCAAAALIALERYLAWKATQG